MNVSNQNERKTLTQSFRTAGYTGSVFGNTKGKYTYSRDARKFAKTRVIAGESGFTPSGMIFDATTKGGTFVKTKDVMVGKSKTKLQKRFAKLGIRFNKRQQALLPPANMQPRLSGTVNVLLERIDRQGNPYRFNAQYQTTVAFKKEGKWKRQLIDELQDRINTSGTKATIIRANTAMNELEYFPKPGQTGTRLDSLRLRKAFLRIDELKDEQGWDTKQDQCVLDFLRYYYEGDPKLAEGLLKDDAFDFCFEEGYKRRGVSAVEIENWCKMAQTKMIALNENYQVVRLYKPTKKDEPENYQGSKARVLIYIIKDSHIHPIIDPRKIKSIVAIVASSDIVNGKTKKIKEIITQQREERAQMPLKLITDAMRCVGGGTTQSTNLHYLCRQMLDEGIDVLGKHIKWGKGGPLEYVMDDVRYKFHHEADDVVKNYVEKCRKEEFTGQSAPQFVYEAMEKLNIKTSHPNPILNELFGSKHAKHKIHQGGKIVSEKYRDPFEDTDDFDWDAYPEAKTFDINKCHTSILQNPAEEWYIFNFKDEVEVFDQTDELSAGMYFVETDDTRLFMGNKFYSRAIVQKGLDEGLITYDNITHQVLCSAVLERDYFEGLFNIYKEMTDDTPEGIEMRKLLNNTTTGILGKTQLHIIEKRITTNIHTAYEYLIDNHDKDIFNHHIPIVKDCVKYDFWCYGTKRKVPKDSNNYAMYNQVLDNQAILLYDYINVLTDGDWDKLLFRKTDAFTLSKFDENLLPAVLGDKVGQLKLETNPTIPREKPYTDVVVDWSKYINDWKEVDDIKSSNDYEIYYNYVRDKKSLMTIGEGGSGKSHIIGKLQEKFKCLTVAPTNCAANNVGGATIHKTFKYDAESQSINKKTLDCILVAGYDAYILDEDEMVGADLIKILYELKKRTDIPFFFFGDWCQLKNFEAFVYKNHSILKSICDYNITPELAYHEKCRMSPALRTLIAPFRSEVPLGPGRLIDKFVETNSVLSRVADLPFTNICFTNSARRSINRDMNAYHYRRADFLDQPGAIQSVITEYFPKAFGENRPYEVYRPHIGMPCICIKNNYDVKAEKNGQRYTITKLFKSQKTFNLAETPEGIREQYVEHFGEPHANTKEEKMKRDLITEFAFNDRVEITCAIKGEEIKYDVSILHFIMNFDMAYAMTNHKVIGLTVRDLCIHQLNFPYVDNNWIYTAFSRGTDIPDIKLCFKY